MTSKPRYNNRITDSNIYGLGIKLDLLLNQSVRVSDSPTFANLQLTGDATVEGNLYVLGNTTVLSSNVIEFDDNIIVLNVNEAGNGVTLNQAGFEINRGTLPSYRIVFNEPDDTFRVGPVSATQAVATREDAPLVNGILVWNDTAKRADARNSIDIDVRMASATNSTNSTTGALTIAGGLGVQKDITVDGTVRLVGTGASNTLYTDDTSNALIAQSVDDIRLQAAAHVKLPFNVKLCFGSTQGSIMADDLFRNVRFRTEGDLYFDVPFTKSINVPSGVPVTFATATEKVYTDGSRNLVVASGEDVNFAPGAGKKVFIAVDTPMAFGTSSQKLLANSANDIELHAGNNIKLVPGQLMNVTIPTDCGILFGNIGTNRVFADNSGNLNVSGTGVIHLSATTRVNVPRNVPLTFDGANRGIYADNNGDMVMSSPCVRVSNGASSSNPTTGSFVVEGGMGVRGAVNVGGNVAINGNLTVRGTTTSVESQTTVVKDNLLVVNSGPAGVVDGGFLVQLQEEGSPRYVGLVYSQGDGEMQCLYTDSDPGATSVSALDHAPFRADTLHTSNDDAAVGIGTGGSLTIEGGASIAKNMFIGGETTALDAVRVALDLDSSCATTGALTVDGGVGVARSLYVGGPVFIEDETTSDSLGGALTVKGGVTILSNDESITYGQGGSLTVMGGASINGDLYVSGSINGSGSSASTYSFLTLTATEEALNLSSGSLVTFGGITTQCDTNALSVTNGGSFLTPGGASIGKDVYIGKKLYVYGETVRFHNETTGLPQFGLTANRASHELSVDRYSALGVFQEKTVVVNGANGSTMFSNTTTSTGVTAGSIIIRGGVSISNTSSATSPTQGGALTIAGGAAISKNMMIGGDVRVRSTTSIANVTSGALVVDGGCAIGGDLLVGGEDVTVLSNSMLLNAANARSLNTGLVLQRFQQANDSAAGDVARDAPAFADTLPDQTNASSTQVVLSAAAGSQNDLYAGWWIRTSDGQVRKIVGYVGGATRVASIETPWTTSPSQGDTVELFNRNYTAMFYDASDDTFAVGYLVSADNVDTHADAQLRVASLHVTDTTPSTLGTSGSMRVMGGVSIACSVDSTNTTTGGALTVLGGASVQKRLRIGTGVGIGSGAFDTPPSVGAHLHVRTTNPTLVLEHSTAGSSSLAFATSDTTNAFDISMSGQNGLLSVRTAERFAALTVSSSGNVGINTTTANSALTLASASFVTADRNDGYLVFTGSNKTSGSARIQMFGDVGLHGGTMMMHPGNNGGALQFFGGDEKESLRIHNDARVDVRSTTASDGGTTASLVVAGGVTIQCSTNAIGDTVGGALTVHGGIAISKDIYIGGDIYVSGRLSSDGSIEEPDIVVTNVSNCAFTVSGNERLLLVSNEAIFSGWVGLTPTGASKRCTFHVDIPRRSNTFTHRGDCVVTCTGWTDDGEVHALFNVVGTAVTGTNRCTITFQSASLAVHYISFMCRYTAS